MVDMTLADLSADDGGGLVISADRAGHVSGQVGPYPGDFGSTFLSTTGCPRLHVQVRVNGEKAALTQPGSGTQIGSPAPIFNCIPPEFQVTLAGGITDELDVLVWDESAKWIMRVKRLQPTAVLEGDAGLRIGTWADLRLVPPPTAYVGLNFDSDAGCAYFSMDCARSGEGCTTDTVVSNVDCRTSSTDAGVASPLRFTDGGVSFFVPDVGAASGVLEVEGWPRTQLLQCDGLATCELDPVGIGAAVGLNVTIPTHTVP